MKNYGKSIKSIVLIFVFSLPSMNLVGNVSGLRSVIVACGSILICHESVRFLVEKLFSDAHTVLFLSSKGD